MGFMKNVTTLISILLVVSAAKSFAQENHEAVPGEYLIKLKETQSLQIQNLHMLAEDLNVKIKAVIPEHRILVVKRPTIELQSFAMKSLSKYAQVEIVEPNYIYRINKAPNDPRYSELWGLKNFGQKDSQGRIGSSGIDIGAEAAWDITTGSDEVIVAVIDTGVNYNQADLKPNMWINEAEANGKPGVDDDKNGVIDDIHGASFTQQNISGNPMDDHGHGSHCAGTIGAKGNDGIGVAGVAWNVKIMGLKFLEAEGGGTLENAIRSIDYATKMGARILSNSWGGGGESSLLKEAIQRSHAAGTLFVAAAGNDSNNNDTNPTYPATYDVPNVLSVAALDNKGQIASFSNFGKRKVHVAAPGVNILSTIRTGYDSWSGTSMAAPHVSGIAVLLASENPNMSGVEMKERIISTSQPVAGMKSRVSSGGIANAYNTLTNALPQPDPNDPSNWKSISVNFSSAHPYKDKTYEIFEVSVPGAQEISVYFSKFQTERVFDKVEIYDSKGVLVETLSGDNDDYFSATITGSKAKLIFQSDDSVTKFGFDITKVAYR